MEEVTKLRHWTLVDFKWSIPDVKSQFWNLSKTCLKLVIIFILLVILIDVKFKDELTLTSPV
jgi:hypothetical protein